MQLERNLEGQHVYGLTQNITTNVYIMVYDEFGPKRDYEYGKCANCNRYNTSEAWCQTCDPQKTTQGWTSGNKDVDNCIKEFQLKATLYEDVIEWIPFNKLDNFQNIGDRFFATWLNGMRHLNCNKEAKDGYRYTQTRTPPCVVELKTLTSSPNLLDALKEVRLYYYICSLFN